MPPGLVEIRPTIDRAWLERAAAVDPIVHAYALWDLDRFPAQVRFFSAIRDETTLGYLLVWLGRRTVPIVHWFGGLEASRGLAEHLPPRPLVVVAPDEVRPDVERVRGPVERHPLLVLADDPHAALPTVDPSTEARRLTGADRPRLLALTSGRSDLVASEYPFLDLDREAVWGCFEGTELRGVARATVGLPTVWILGGVYVDPATRGRGFGLALARAVLAEARPQGVVVGLFVREDRPAARTVYERAGFRPHGHRSWLDAGAALEP